MSSINNYYPNDYYFFDEFVSNYVSVNNRFVDLNGNPVKNNPFNSPYSYDEYVLYKSDDFNIEDCSASYSDRMLSWNPSKFYDTFNDVWSNASGFNLFDNKMPEDISKFLSKYFNDNLMLTALIKGCNVSNGNPYYAFFYKKI